jgi:alpha-beta hydrolase superfamily lysophospholipase
VGRERGAFVLKEGRLRRQASGWVRLATELNELGVAAAAMDLHGHGRSGGVRLDVTEFRNYARDLSAFVRALRKRFGAAVPLFAMGESMGGLVSYQLSLMEPSVRGVVFLAPALGIDPSLVPNPVVLRLDEHDPNRDNDWHYRLRMAWELYAATMDAQENLKHYNVPFLVMHGSADAVTSPDISRRLFHEAASVDKTLVIAEGARHAIFYEGQDVRRAAFQCIADWILQRASKKHVEAVAEVSIPPAKEPFEPPLLGSGAARGGGAASASAGDEPTPITDPTSVAAAADWK